MATPGTIVFVNMLGHSFEIAGFAPEGRASTDVELPPVAAPLAPIRPEAPLPGMSEALMSPVFPKADIGACTQPIPVKKQSRGDSPGTLAEAREPLMFPAAVALRGPV